MITINKLGLKIIAGLVMLFLIITVGLLSLSTKERGQPEIAPGYYVASLNVSHRDTPLSLHIWYPTRQRNKQTLIGQNALFYGFYAQVDAKPKTEKLPVVVLSHGSGGNAVRIGWLASYLANQGIVVVAPNHPGTTSGDSDPFQTIKIWERPQDLSAVLDFLHDTPPLNMHLDLDHVGVVGFSLGGHSAMSLSGIRVLKQKFIDYCKKNMGKVDCGWLSNAGVNFSEIEKKRYQQSNKDSRIGVTVAIDPALPLAIDPSSLSELNHPSLLINLGAPKDVLNGNRVDKLASALQQAEYISIPEAYHFSFLAECSTLGYVIIGLVGEENICSDSGVRNRGVIHNELKNYIGNFLAAHL